MSHRNQMSEDCPRPWPGLRLLRPLARASAAPPAPPQGPATRLFHLDARFGSAGAWSGVSDLAGAAYADLRGHGCDAILHQHMLALHMVLPDQRDVIRPPYMCLTDTAGDAEKTRFHPLDRAYRLVHDLVGLVLQWKQALDDDGNWVVVAWNFDAAEHLATRFFAELARRSAGRHGIDIHLSSVSDKQDAMLQPLGIEAVEPPPALALLERALPATPALTGAEAARLEQAFSDGDNAVLEQNHASLIGFYRAAGNDVAAASVSLKMFVLYNNYGYYHEARRFMDDALPHWQSLVCGDEEKSTYYAGKMHTCLIMVNEPDAALRLLQDLAVSRLSQPHLLANVNYSLGMHFLRYAPSRDLSRAEHHLLRAAELNMAAAKTPGVTPDPFKKVFFDNGLAFLRVRQGRLQDALDLCQAGYAYLTAALGETRHCLHRSVLQYNIAHLYVMLGDIDGALRHFNNAIAMDPNYSEYYNEAGNLLQERGSYREAIEHYQLAIGRSAPYPEVYFNKAVCHMRLDEWDAALACFDTSLDLNPNQPEACAYRADLLRELGRLDEALLGYDDALALGCRSTAVRVNRAVLRYASGLYDRALADMDAVIAQEPDEPAHYENRAAIHQAMEREDLYLRDLGVAARCKELA